MWKTLALLLCIQVCAHDPMYPRVASGADARKKDYPWMVSLHNPTCHFCGGSLISKRWVLSAAHCFFRKTYTVRADNILVYLGKLTQREKNKREVMKNVEKLYTHISYDQTITNNDIALLYLSSDVKFNSYMSPVRLVAQGSDFKHGTSCQIIGWGQISTEENVPYPGTLQEAEVFVEDNNQCQNKLTQLIIKNRQLNHLQITDNMICAGVPTGGIDTGCGDSGGPMSHYHCSEWVQSGITSWGIGCGRSDMPGVYTRVSKYQQWITDTITKHPSQDLPKFINVNPPCPTG